MRRARWRERQEDRRAETHGRRRVVSDAYGGLTRPTSFMCVGVLVSANKTANKKRSLQTVAPQRIWWDKLPHCGHATVFLGVVSMAPGVASLPDRERDKVRHKRTSAGRRDGMWRQAGWCVYSEQQGAVYSEQQGAVYTVSMLSLQSACFWSDSRSVQPHHVAKPSCPPPAPKEHINTQ